MARNVIVSGVKVTLAIVSSGLPLSVLEKPWLTGAEVKIDHLLKLKSRGAWRC
jgi:hypothetical protein